MSSFREGDILVWPGQMYEHWGVYSGHGTVVHYAGQGSSVCKQMSNSHIVQSPLEKEDFRQIEVWKTHENFEDRCRVVERAQSRIGEGGYSVAFNNCEHFAKWCDGESTSAQVGAVVKTAAGVVGATAIGAVGSGLVVPALTISAAGGSTAVASLTVTVLPQLAGPTFTLLTTTGPVGLVVGGGILGAAGMYAAYKWLRS